MISYVSGKLVRRQPTFIIVETGGIGYQIFISLYTYAQLEKLETVKVLTHLVIKEDAHSLYGFMTEEERYLFIALISVSGIGPKTAQLILSSLDPATIQLAIVTEDVSLFKKVKGIGLKTAQRLVMDLKDDFLKSNTITPVPEALIVTEAITALVSLGFNKKQVEAAVKSIMALSTSEPTLEELIKSVLKNLA